VIRALIGDLAVATVELQAMPSPPSTSGPERFARLYQHGYKLFLLAVEVGVTRAIDREVVEVGMIAPLVEAFEGTMLLYQLCTGLEDAFSWRRQATPYGYVLARPWQEVCLYRSALEFLGDLLRGVPALAEEVDLGEADQLMRQHVRVVDPQEVPAGMPASHWWWFGRAPA